MCELFAVCSSEPARVRLRFAEFATHGAPRHGGNPDGWGAAYFDGRDAHVLREPIAATRSAFVHVLEDHEFHSPLVLSHVRRASRGPVALANTQPFSHEMAGRRHVFAHNGDLPDARAQWTLGEGCAWPIGQTDSEHAFCQLLRALAPLWRAAQPPSVQARCDTVSEFAATMRSFGPANFLYTDGELLFAHADRRRQADDEVRPPGLHLLLRGASNAHEHRAEGLHLSTPDAARKHPLALVASVPLGGGHWSALGAGELVVLRAGERLR
ncbi:putative glutamine amidotransferase YafJ [mine drainage metagenome]|jgi:glutamine amidotransferase|uniref:Putative glutamine amidotransferase YafJ n=1 Tax=mine drainage metagenome TaxID=410659 RepID=A0A1J5QN33_9ZZZZ